MSSQTITKEDIDILTKNILKNRAKIIQTLYDEHIELDTALLYANYRNALQTSSDESTVIESKESFIDREPISLDEFESIYNALDEIDKKLPDASKGGGDFKEPKGLRRYNSKMDMTDKALHSSMSNLTIIKKTNAPFLSPPPMKPPPPPPPSTANSKELSVKLTDDDLVEFNALKKQLKIQLDALDTIDSDEDPFNLAGIGRKISDSFDRLQMFFNEISPLAKADHPTAAKVESTVWNILDDQWIYSLRKLSEVHISFIRSSHQISYRKYTHNDVDRLVFLFICSSCHRLKY